ncbi:MAG: thioesterase [Defluviitaleaceae bacterium]|nr:thioesterase [Defluviitaleaceae bacterium]
MITTNKFNLDYRVGFNSLLPDNTMSLCGLMEYVQEASLYHTHSIPGAFDYYDEMNWVWVLTHWQVEIYDTPKVADIINISTWAVGYKAYFGERGFEVMDKAGKRLLVANSNWILLDRNNLKPVRPTEYIAQKYGERHPFLITKDFGMPKMDGFNPISTHNYTATRRDMDTNRHVNNVNYLKWVYNFIDDDLYLNYRPSTLKVAYKKETYPGDDLKISLYKKIADDGNVETMAVIEKDGHIATEIFIGWKKV